MMAFGLVTITLCVGYLGYMHAMKENDQQLYEAIDSEGERYMRRKTSKWDWKDLWICTCVDWDFFFVNASNRTTYGIYVSHNVSFLLRPVLKYHGYAVCLTINLHEVSSKKRQEFFNFLHKFINSRQTLYVWRIFPFVRYLSNVN